MDRVAVLPLPPVDSPVCEVGREHISVTTAINKLDKPALAPAAARVVAEFAADHAGSINPPADYNYHHPQMVLLKGQGAGRTEQLCLWFAEAVRAKGFPKW